MSTETSIEWTHRPGFESASWNPIRGCSVVSPGCINCYAMKFAHRFSGPGKPFEGLTKQTAQGPQWTGKVALIESSLRDPLSWRKPTTVFVNSMSDLFHDEVPDEYIDRVFAVMALTPQHTYQVLTKRPERMRAYVVSRGPGGEPHEIGVYMKALAPDRFVDGKTDVVWPLPNVWLGVSTEDQQRADERIPILLDTPAAVRFISAEPLLGAIDLNNLDMRRALAQYDASYAEPRDENDPEILYDVLTGHMKGPDDTGLPHLDWVIVGGESGPRSRAFDIAWARSLRDQCAEAGVAFFLKQLGAKPRACSRPRSPLPQGR